MLDLYCERLGPGLLAEPVNALTNLGFLLAALLVWRRADGRGDVRLLAALLATIGVGSALFHTLATPLAQLADVLPIGVLQLTFLWLYLRRVMAVGPAWSTAWLALYIAALAAAAPLRVPLNGSLAYAPAAAALAIIGVVHWRRFGRGDMLLTVGVFLASLTARTLDMRVCAAWPLGTHFLWHLLNAVMLYLLLGAYAHAAATAARH